MLSPLPLSIFINSLTALLTVSCHFYADDSQIYTTTAVDDVTNAIRHVNFNLNTINTWRESYGLSINPSKSQFCILGNATQLSKFDCSLLPSVMLDNCKIKFSTCVKIWVSGWILLCHRFLK